MTAAGIPWYVHPATDPAAWAALAALDPRPRFVVVNVHDGPGSAVDPYYPSALGALGHLDLVGYVDLAYGERPRAEVLDDVWAWRARYDVAGILFDQVPADGRDLVALADLVRDTRRLGARLVIANPGVVPAADHLELFDVTCVFEGDASAHAVFVPPGWLRGVPSDRIWHLVHGCADAERGAVLRRARHLGAGVAWASTGTLPNPWDRLDGPGGGGPVGPDRRTGVLTDPR